MSPRSALAAVRSAVSASRRALPLARLEALARRLELTTPRGFAGRSRRIRLFVLRRLGLVVDARELPPSELAVLVARRLSAASEPIYSLAWSAAWLVLTLLFAAALLVGASCVVSPAARAYFFPPDLGATARWQTSTTYPGGPQSGLGAGSPGPLFFHTLEQADASIVLTFQRTVAVRRVRVTNRSDCCQERALPLDVEALSPKGSKLLCQRRSPFSRWTCDADGVRTQALRIRHPGTGTLHLARIEVFE